MKKYWILLIAALVALVSCGKEVLDPVDGDDSAQSTTITFNLAANHPADTRAVKSGWEEGDAIFVFFTGAATPKHLKMTYSNSSWTSTEYDGSTLSAGALGLKNGDSGTMRAVFLPFGSDATVSASDGSFTFSTTYYAYYLTATLSYTVTNNEVSGAFSMTIPDGYVQFFIKDANATDGAYTLGTDAVIPVGVASIAADGSIVETSDKVAGNDMVGYAYGSGDAKGYLFSGKLTSWSYGSNYYFAKTKVADGSRADYFAQPANALASHSAVKLPSNDNVYAIDDFGIANDGKWIPVGNGITVPLSKVEISVIYILGEPRERVSVTLLGNWFTCNYGQSVPEALGTLYSFDNANALGVSLPTKDQFELINNSSYCSYTWLKVHGQQGVVIKADRGFLFLPAQYETYGRYWSSTESDDDDGCLLYFNNSGNHLMRSLSRSNEYAVRPFQN